MLGATHFHELFENGFLRARPGLQYGRMEVHLDNDAVEMENQITYLYKCDFYSCSAFFLILLSASNSVGATAASAACEWKGASA